MTTQNIIVDIDFTISNAKWRQIYADKAKEALAKGEPDVAAEQWDVFHSKAKHDAPYEQAIQDIMAMAGARRAEGYEVVFWFLTGRYHRFRGETEAWLQKHWGGHNWGVFMRPDDDRTPTPEWKRQRIEAAEFMPGSIHAFIDDEPDNLAAAYIAFNCATYLAKDGSIYRWRTPTKAFAPPEIDSSTVAAYLADLAKLYKERHDQYGDNYKQFGTVMQALDHCDGGEWTIATEEQWNRLGCLVQIVSKLTRYCANFSAGGHDDSLADLAVYSQMLRELDEEGRS